MKIALVGTYPWDSSRISGGVEYVMVNLVEALREQDGLELHVVSLLPHRQGDKTVRRGNVTLHYLQAARRFSNITQGWWDHRRIRQRLRTLAPDLIHFQNAPAFAYTGWAGLPACPVLLTLHGIIHQEVKFQNGRTERLRSYFRIRQEMAALKKIRHLVTLNPYVEKSVGPLTCAAMHRIDNPVNANYFKLKRDGAEGNILFVGFISRLKNVLTLIRAVAQLSPVYPGLKVAVAGAVSDREYYGEVEKYLDDHALRGQIRFLGHLSEAQLQKEYRACSFLVSTSVHENSPIAVQQAMAAGKPVVATRVGGVPHLVADGKTGFLVEPDDVDALVEKLKVLLEDDRLRERFGKNARAEAQKRFLPAAVARKTINLYRHLIAKS